MLLLPKNVAFLIGLILVRFYREFSTSPIEKMNVDRQPGMRFGVFVFFIVCLLIKLSENLV